MLQAVPRIDDGDVGFGGAQRFGFLGSLLVAPHVIGGSRAGVRFVGRHDISLADLFGSEQVSPDLWKRRFKCKPFVGEEGRFQEYGVWGGTDDRYSMAVGPGEMVR